MNPRSNNLAGVDNVIPRPGMLAAVRKRRGTVTSVSPFDGETGRLHLVHLEYRDGGSPSDERLLWELEPRKTLLEPTALPDASRSDPMPPADFDALLRAARWTALSPYLGLDGNGREEGKGIGAFLTQNGGEGWLLPETLRLADYGLGHDDRAQHHQPVASRLGPRFCDWQLAQSAEEDRRECHLHARNLLGRVEYVQLLGRLVGHRRRHGQGHHDLLFNGFTHDLIGDTSSIDGKEFGYSEADQIFEEEGAARRVAGAGPGYPSAPFRRPGQTEMFPRSQTELPL